MSVHDAINSLLDVASLVCELSEGDLWIDGERFAAGAVPELVCAMLRVHHRHPGFTEAKLLRLEDAWRRWIREGNALVEITLLELEEADE